MSVVTDCFVVQECVFSTTSITASNQSYNTILTTMARVTPAIALKRKRLHADAGFDGGCTGQCRVLRSPELCATRTGSLPYRRGLLVVLWVQFFFSPRQLPRCLLVCSRSLSSCGRPGYSLHRYAARSDVLIVRVCRLRASAAILYWWALLRCARGLGLPPPPLPPGPS